MTSLRQTGSGRFVGCAGRGDLKYDLSLSHPLLLTAILACVLTPGMGCHRRGVEGQVAALPPVNRVSPTTVVNHAPPQSLPEPAYRSSQLRKPGDAMEPDDRTSLQEIAELEAEYNKTSDNASRVDVIFRMSNLGGASALAAMGRLFKGETDAELRAEMLNALGDIAGYMEQKVALLSAGVAAGQPQQVRLSAIEVLTDVDPSYSLRILETLTSDSDEDVQEAAKDAVQVVHALMNAQPGAARATGNSQ